jgi:predicted nucleic acid-binding protein
MASYVFDTNIVAALMRGEEQPLGVGQALQLAHGPLATRNLVHFNRVSRLETESW